MCDALSSKDGLFISSHMERTVLCPSTGPGPLLNYTPWDRQSWGGGPCHPCGSPCAPPPNPAPIPQLRNTTPLIRQDAPSHLETRLLFPSTEGSSHSAPLPSPASLVALSTPPPRNAPLPRGQGRGYPTSLTRTARLRQMTFHGRTGAPRAPLCICWVPSSPSPRRTAPTSSPRSAASPPASAASPGGGPGGGRGGASRAARWPPGLVVSLLSLAAPGAPLGLHLPGVNAESQPATGPPHPHSGQLALKGTRPDWQLAG